MNAVLFALMFISVGFKIIVKDITPSSGRCSFVKERRGNPKDTQPEADQEKKTKFFFDFHTERLLDSKPKPPSNDHLCYDLIYCGSAEFKLFRNFICWYTDGFHM